MSVIWGENFIADINVFVLVVFYFTGRRVRLRIVGSRLGIISSEEFRAGFLFYEDVFLSGIFGRCGDRLESSVRMEAAGICGG